LANVVLLSHIYMGQRTTLFFYFGDCWMCIALSAKFLLQGWGVSHWIQLLEVLFYQNQFHMRWTGFFDEVFRLFRLERIVLVFRVWTQQVDVQHFIYWQGQRVCDALFHSYHSHFRVEWKFWFQGLSRVLTFRTEFSFLGRSINLLQNEIAPWAEPPSTH
jgi:hypothetical protein